MRSPLAVALIWMAGCGVTTAPPTDPAPTVVVPRVPSAPPAKPKPEPTAPVTDCVVSPWTGWSEWGPWTSWTLSPDGFREVRIRVRVRTIEKDATNGVSCPTLMDVETESRRIK
jgi:hypothetical protein